MTSIKKKPVVLGVKRSIPEQERDQFQKSQDASFRKAINDEEVPIKMKHVRNLIIGTHTDQNASVFWGLVTLSPPLNTDISAWKFCHTLHLILRDGHENALRNSFEQLNRIKNMGEHFAHLSIGYGSLIQRYCSLLVCKLTFHKHYSRFPGALHVSPEELESISDNDANKYFEMAIEMMEYMEKILDLYEAVFRSLNPSRSNSMTKMGQCRLAPLIPCIQDSSSLYDFLVRILFFLHKVVPTDMLSGHRSRFNDQFKSLHQFYSSTRNLQYFKSLIQVPHLPQVAPNFLVQSELRSHVAPVVVLEEEEDTVASDTVLIDTSEPEPPPVPPHPHPDVINSHNGALLEVMAERESLINSLYDELRGLRATVQTLRSEASYAEEQFKLKVNDMESTIAELDSELMAERHTKESIFAQVEAAAASAEAVAKLSSEEIRRRSAEDKYSKLKDVYLKLRDEHIALIRSKAEIEKTLETERDSALKTKHTLESQMGKLQSEFLANESDFSLESCVRSSVEAATMNIAYSLSHFDLEAHNNIKCNKDYTIQYKNPINESLSALFSSYANYLRDKKQADSIVKNVDLFGHHVSCFLLYAKATSHASTIIDAAQNLVTALEELAKYSTDLLQNIKNKSSIEEENKYFGTQFERCCDLLSACEDISLSSEDTATILEREIEIMDRAIHEAVEKFSKLLDESRAKHTGVQLEVNEVILSSCSDLMSEVRVLVQRAAELQSEIVASGRKGVCPREFYKRNHRWTEGLISGAKSVALACQLLVNAADQVAKGKGKLEEVMVSSREIAASSMQLVMASRVKADKNSDRLTNLNRSAKNISTLTGTVVATAESCRDKMEATTLDFSNLTLHLAKRLEMETLVKVLETEKQLETERTRLAELRKQHYNLAGEIEGWDQHNTQEK